MISSFWKTIPTAKLALLTPFGARSISMLSSWAVKIRWFYTSTFSKILAPGMRIRLDRHAGLAGAADGDCEAGGGSAYQYAVAGDHCGIPLSLNRLDNQIALIREDYRKKCVALADALESRLGEHLEFSRPQGDVPVGAFPLSVRYHGMDEENAGKRRGVRPG